MRRTILAGVAVITLAGCAGNTPAATPLPPRPAATQPPAPLIPATAADKAVCHRFLAQAPGKAGANAYMAWSTFGAGQATSNHAAGKLITATVTWFDDAYQSWGNPWNATPDWDAVTTDCASIGVKTRANCVQSLGNPSCRV